MHCPQCGAQLESGAKFCTTCGASTSSQAPLPSSGPARPATPSYSPPQQQPYQPQAGPSYPGAPAPAGMERPANYLPWSIGVTLCCCVVGGIVGIVYSVQANSKWEAGDYAGSHQAASSARKWLIASAIIGLILNALSFMTFFIPAFMAAR